MKTPKVHTFVLAGLQAKIKCNIEVEVFEKTILIRFELDLPENEDVTSFDQIIFTSKYPKLRKDSNHHQNQS